MTTIHYQLGLWSLFQTSLFWNYQHTKYYLSRQIFNPLDFISKLAALVPKPRVNLTRFHGVFAPNSKHRARVTPGKGRKFNATDDSQDKSPEECRASMTWAQRLKRVFDMDVEICDQCGGGIKDIACIEDPMVIKKILDHMNSKSAVSEKKRLPQSRAPPQGCLFN